jgi:hypothetical protein
MATQLVSTAYFISLAHHFVFLCVFLLSFLGNVSVKFIPPPTARQRFGKHVHAATNAQVITEALLEASFSMLSVSYQRNVGYYFFPELLVQTIKSIFCYVRDISMYHQN